MPLPKKFDLFFYLEKQYNMSKSTCCNLRKKYFESDNSKIESDYSYLLFRLANDIMKNNYTLANKLQKEWTDILEQEAQYKKNK